MITHKAQMLAVDLMAELGGQDGLAINRGMIDLIVELGGDRKKAERMVTPAQQLVYMMCLLINGAVLPFRLVPKGPSQPLEHHNGEDPPSVA